MPFFLSVLLDKGSRETLKMQRTASAEVAMFAMFEWYKRNQRRRGRYERWKV